MTVSSTVVQKKKTTKTSKHNQSVFFIDKKESYYDDIEALNPVTSNVCLVTLQNSKYFFYV